MTQTETKDTAGFETLQRPELKKVYKWIFELGAAALVLFYVYSAGFGSASEQFHLGFYLLLTFALIGIFYRCRKNSPVSRPSLHRPGHDCPQHLHHRLLDCRIPESCQSGRQLQSARYFRRCGRDRD